MATRTKRIASDGRTFSYVLHSSGDTQLSITQNDVRAIQLAKAALRAGIDLLVEHAGSPDVSDIRLAGAFGAHIDPVHAMVLGLVPDCPVDGVRRSVTQRGPARCRPCSSRALRVEMESAVRQVTKIETATEPRFPELFVAAMALLHATSRRRTRRPWSTCRLGSPLHPAGAVAEFRTEPAPGTGDAVEVPNDVPNDVPTDVMEDVSDRWLHGVVAVERVGRSRGRRQSCRGAVRHPPPHARRADLGRGPRDPRTQRRHDPRGGRCRDPRLPRAP